MPDTPYKKFLTDAFENFSISHNQFKKQYLIDDYDRWFYQQATELLTFSDARLPELQFKYIPVGTYSKQSETWMWSWFNQSSIEHSKADLRPLKEFGLKRSFPKIRDGTFESHPDEGWEFIAIAHQYLGGIGGYRIESDGLLKYFLVERVVDEEEVRQRLAQVVNCKTHVEGRAAFVCHHLSERNGTGFEEAFESSEEMKLAYDDNFQAWCADCEIVRAKTDGWNDESMKFADIKIVCEQCYFELKRGSI